MARKDVAFKMRIDEGLRRAFLNACQAVDRPAAQVLREFMRNYVAEQKSTYSASIESRSKRVDVVEATSRRD